MASTLPSSHHSSDQLSDRIDESTTILINYITKHQLPVLEAVHAKIPNLKIWVSVEMEPQRDYSAEFGTLPVTIQKNITFKKKWHHRAGFTDQLNVHFPYDTLWRLFRSHPECVVSFELGPRSIFSAIYRLLRRRCRLVLCVNVSEHTETSWGWLRRHIRPWLLKSADVVTYNGPSCQRYLQSIGVPPEKLVHFPYCAHPNTVAQGSTHRSFEDRYRLLYVGQLVERKNPVSMVQQLIRWAEAHPHRNIDLSIIGRGPLEEDLQALDVPDNLTLTLVGSVDPQAMPAIWERHGILIFPTLADEWGMVVNEAMHSGLPVLGSQCAQSALSLVKDGVNGFLFDPMKAESIFRAFDQIMSCSLETVDQMGAQSRKTVEELTPEFSASCLIKALRSALSS